VFGKQILCVVANKARFSYSEPEGTETVLLPSHKHLEEDDGRN
jgi:hypothetical protein